MVVMNIFYLRSITSEDVTSPKVRNYTRISTEVVHLNASRPLELESFIHPAYISFFHSWLLTLFQAETTRAYTDFICFHRKSNYLRMLSFLSPLLKIFFNPTERSYHLWYNITVFQCPDLPSKTLYPLTPSAEPTDSKMPLSLLFKMSFMLSPLVCRLSPSDSKFLFLKVQSLTCFSSHVLP